MKTALLKEKIKNSGLKLGFIADKTLLTYQGLRNKILDKYDFTVSEAIVIGELLNLSYDEFKEIFREDF